MKADIIVPAYNEGDRLATTLTPLMKEDWVNEIIVVDDGSADNTKIIAERLAHTVISHDKNKGKTAAIMTGLTAVKANWIILLDADLGESASEAKKLVSPLTKNRADMTVAVLPQLSKRGFGLMKNRAQKIIIRETSFEMTAPLSGQRGFHRRWIPIIMDSKSYGFGLEMYLNLVFLSRGAVVKEVKTNMYHRATGKDLRGFYHRAKQWMEMEITYGLIRN